MTMHKYPHGDEQLPCANCGCPDSSKFRVWYYDGEGVCSKECHEQHEKLGCPFETSTSYRPCPHTKDS